MRQLSVVLATARLPVKVVTEGMAAGAWFEVQAVNNSTNRAFGLDQDGNPMVKNLSANAELLTTASRASVPHYQAVIQKGTSFYLSDFVFATIEEARRHYAGKNVVKLATELPAISLTRAG